MPDLRPGFRPPSSVRLLWLAVLAILLALSACAQTFTLEQVMSSPFPANLVAASHAPRLAWVFDAKGARNVWIADGPNFAARQVTPYQGDDREPIASRRLTPGGRPVVYARGSETNAAARVDHPTSGVAAR